MAIVSRGDKVVYSYPTGDSFTNGEQYEVCEITDGYIAVIDKNGKACQYNYNIFISVFSLPNTLQVSQAKEDVRSYNVGQSDYSKHKIQPWDIWLEYNLNPWDADIIKRILRTKETDSRKLDYEKIIHIAKERIRQIDAGYE